MSSQPYAMGTLKPSDRVALVDAVSTAADDHVYLHMISRSFDKSTPISLDLKDLDLPDGPAVLHLLTGNLKADPATKVNMEETHLELKVRDGIVMIDLLPRVIASLQVSKQ